MLYCMTLDVSKGSFLPDCYGDIPSLMYSVCVCVSKSVSFILTQPQLLCFLPARDRARAAGFPHLMSGAHCECSVFVLHSAMALMVQSL